MVEAQQKRRKAVAWWLLAGVIMVIIQTALGGITRLTGSGLSITQWKPILGAVPPLNQVQWQAAFDRYKEIGQFKTLNSDFTLSNFKAIYFWEWMHREWGRLIGVVFLIGFAYFLIKKYFEREMILPIGVLFFLGGIQGAIGWIMVASGLNDTSLYVDHIKLAIHFISALILGCYTFWFALQLLVPKERISFDKKLHRFTLVVIGVLCVQLVYGAFMAGLKAAVTAPSWPTINGEWIPSNTSSFGNRSYAGGDVFTDHPLMVHFIHRNLAYLLTLLIIMWFSLASKLGRLNPKGIVSRWRWWPLLLVLVQVILGVVTVLWSPKAIHNGFGPFEIVAQTHQLVAMFLLLALLANLYAVRSRKG